MSGLVELLVAALVTAAVMASVLGVVGSAQATLRSQADAQDATQRLRVAGDVLRRDLMAATLVLPFGEWPPQDHGVTVRQGTFRRTYYFDAAAAQLRRIDNGRSDVPVLDGVQALTFDWLGDDGPIASARLVDGPWLPSAGSADRFDADALRIRLVRIHVTVDGRGAPDVSAAFDVAPRFRHGM